MKPTVTAKEFLENNPIANDLKSLKQFAYSIHYSKVPLLLTKEVRWGIASILMGKLVEKLDALSIYAGDNLSVESDHKDGGIHVTFRDDIYHFAVVMDDEKFAFVRQGGKLADLFSLADVLLDEITSIYHEIAAYLEGLKSQGGPSFHFSPHSCSYTYELAIKDFTPAKKTTQQVFTNYELMERLVPSVQAKSSPLYSVGLKNRGRTDLKISGTLEIEKVDWVAWVQVEAPGNQNYSTMELKFQLTSTLHDNPDGSRVPFNTASIGKWRSSAISFLKEKIFCGFLQDWLNDVNFQCSDK